MNRLTNTPNLLDIININSMSLKSMIVWCIKMLQKMIACIKITFNFYDLKIENVWSVKNVKTFKNNRKSIFEVFRTEDKLFFLSNFISSIIWKVHMLNHINIFDNHKQFKERVAYTFQLGLFTSFEISFLHYFWKPLKLQIVSFWKI